MHNSALAPVKTSPPLVSLPNTWPGVSWIQASFHWVLFYAGWLSVVHLSMQTTWTTVGGLGLAAAWWVLLHWHPVRFVQPNAWLDSAMGLTALVGLLVSVGWGPFETSLIGVVLYVFGLSYLAQATRSSNQQDSQRKPLWGMALVHATALVITLTLASSYMLWLEQWAWFAVMVLLCTLLLLYQRLGIPARVHKSQRLGVGLPDPTMALMMAFLPLFSLWCATPWLSANQHLALHLLAMAVGHMTLLFLLRMAPQMAQHSLWGHVLCLSATGLVWASNDTTIMLLAMVVLAAGSAWLQSTAGHAVALKLFALILGVVAIALTAHASHTMGPDALGLGLVVSSLVFAFSQMIFSFWSRYEQR